KVLTVISVIVAAKFIVTFALVLAYRRPIRSALLIAASLAQIGEFSFIIAGLGIALGVLTPEGRNLILAGSIASIVLNPLLLRAINVLEEWFQGHPAIAARIERDD